MLSYILASKAFPGKSLERLEKTGFFESEERLATLDPGSELRNCFDSVSNQDTVLDFVKTLLPPKNGKTVKIPEVLIFWEHEFENSSEGKVVLYRLCLVGGDGELDGTYTRHIFLKRKVPFIDFFLRSQIRAILRSSLPNMERWVVATFQRKFGSAKFLQVCHERKKINSKKRGSLQKEDLPKALNFCRGDMIVSFRRGCISSYFEAILDRC